MGMVAHSTVQPPTEAGAGGVERASWTVLVVDSDTNMRDLIETVLQRAGYQVLTAADAAAAKSQIQMCTTDLVIMDFSLPDIAGLAFLGQLKQDAATRALPVLIVSTYGDTELRASSAELGAVGYLSKPFRVRELVATVDRILTTGSCEAAE